MNYTLRTAEGKTMQELECREILEQVAKRKLNSLMIYLELSDIFNLLNLHGYKRSFEYKNIKEEKEYLHLKKWVIEKHGIILSPHLQLRKEINPVNVKTVGHREKITRESKQKIISEIFTEINKYLTETLRIHEEAYMALFEKGYISDSMIVQKFINKLEKAIKKNKREWIKLSDVNYSLDFIYEFQKEKHDRYKEKMKYIGMCTD
ncbi:hypothetical protein [Cetobacterium sp.]|uniref:hypothetical protein n=1 Tax=Cetobacterium sp. TaxID=2071632 RepID=UPI003F3C3A6E